MKLHLLRETWSHMSAVSGFDPLFSKLHEMIGARALSHHVPAVLPPSPLPQRVLAKIGLGRQPLFGSHVSPFVETRHAIIGRDCLATLARHSNDLLLLSAGENQFASVIAQAPADIRNRIFLCLHQPPAWFRLHWRESKALSGLGGIFALCANQAAFLRDYSGSPVHETRHGVCLDFFSPGDAPHSAPPRFLFVGQWLRDFDTLAKTIPLILSERPDACFDLVVPPSARQRECLYPVAMRPEVSWHAGISPEALLALYRSATALLVPLTDSTANNAILEAMACGIPVITSDVGGVRDYLPKAAGILCPVGDAEAHARAAVSLAAHPDTARIMGQHARSHAEEYFGWERIAEQVVRAIGISG